MTKLAEEGRALLERAAYGGAYEKYEWTRWLRVNAPALLSAQEKLERAVEVLRPFSDVIEEYDPADENDGTPGTFVCGSLTDYSLCLGDLRAARDFLASMIQPTSATHDMQIATDRSTDSN